ncbi:MAG: DUF6488 family protein, partial [Terricaulis sp.]
MMRVILLALSLTLAAATPATAHPEDEAFVTRNPQVLAMSNADYVLIRMMNEGVIEQSWRNTPPSSATLRQRNGASEWVVIYRNPAVADPEHRTLYVLLSTTSQYIAA